MLTSWGICVVISRKARAEIRHITPLGIREATISRSGLAVGGSSVRRYTPREISSSRPLSFSAERICGWIPDFAAMPARIVPPYVRIIFTFCHEKSLENKK